MKQLNKIINKIVISIILIGIITNFGVVISNAKEEEEPKTLSEMGEQANSWIDKGKALAGDIDSGEVSRQLIPIGQALTTIGSIVFVACILILATKYMKANPDEQAKIKQQAFGLVIAGIVIFGAFSIWSMLYNYFKDM